MSSLVLAKPLKIKRDSLLKIMDFLNCKDRDGFWEAYRGCAEEKRVRPDRSPFYVNWAKDFANFLPRIRGTQYLILRQRYLHVIPLLKAE